MPAFFIFISNLVAEVAGSVKGLSHRLRAHGVSAINMLALLSNNEGK